MLCPRLFLATTAVSTGILISLAFRDKNIRIKMYQVYIIYKYTPRIFLSLKANLTNLTIFASILLGWSIVPFDSRGFGSNRDCWGMSGTYPYCLSPHFEGHKKTKEFVLKICMQCSNPKWQPNVHGSPQNNDWLISLSLPILWSTHYFS